jgi:hypothetical protein
MPRIVIELIFMSQAMQIYKTTNALYLLFYVAAHTTQTADNISCVAHVHPTRPAGLVLRSLVFFLFGIYFMLLCLYFCISTNIKYIFSISVNTSLLFSYFFCKNSKTGFNLFFWKY